MRLPKQVVTPTGLTVGGPDRQADRPAWRRAKFLIFDLSDGLALVFHLRLAGQLVHRDAQNQTSPRAATRSRWARRSHALDARHLPLDDASVLYLTDIRQFGRVWILPESAVQPLLDQAKLGEPLDPDFTLGAFRERIARRQKMPLASRSCSTSRSSADRPSTPTRSSSRAS